MKHDIALGFHGCIDFECVWNVNVIQRLIQEFRISFGDLSNGGVVDTERKILTTILWYMHQGTGGEFVPSTSEIVRSFAERFDYSVTIGGTAARAAIALQKIGYGSALQICCNNPLFKQLLPEEINYISSIPETSDHIYPHVSLQYPVGCHITLTDGSFVTEKPNRILFSRDPDSIAMRITDEFYPMITDAKVFLLSCFSEMLDETLLLSRLDDTINTLKQLHVERFVFMEDGCYEIRNLRFLTHRKLAPYINALSMNEDEFFELIGYKVDLLNVHQVRLALEDAYAILKIPNLIVHSSLWALAYGKDAQRLEKSLRNGVTMASTRFRMGDNFDYHDFADTMKYQNHAAGEQFCEQLSKFLGNLVCCVPGKDMNHITHPTTVGLGDFFAGGLVSGMVDLR